MIISKELALILKEKGFNLHCDNRYLGKKMSDNSNELINWKDESVKNFLKYEVGYCDKEAEYLKERYFDKFLNDDDPDFFIAAPTEHQVLNWVFEKWFSQKEGDSLLLCTIPEYNEWLKFWYTTLIKYEFSLIYEFIGRLEEWFENNAILIVINRDDLNWHYDLWKLESNPDDDYLIKSMAGNKSRQEAKHESILKCFEILKEK